MRIGAGRDACQGTGAATMYGILNVATVGATAAAATGIAYQAAPAARVVAPCAGRVVYAGPFRSYGKLLILDCGRGYHVVLSGFERLDAQVGQALGAGAPVGVMPGWDPRATAIRPALSVELRHAGEPINPLPFLG